MRAWHHVQHSLRGEVLIGSMAPPNVQLFSCTHVHAAAMGMIGVPPVEGRASADIILF